MIDEDEIIDSVCKLFANKVPFHRLVNFRITRDSQRQVSLRFGMSDQLVGNFMRGSLYGGINATILDVIGGIVAVVEVLKTSRIATLDKKLGRFSNLDTTDLRADYLRPGVGEEFVTTGYVLRTGRTVVVTRMALHNDTQTLIAVDTQACIVD